jgi:hypothetical protein
MPKHASLPTSRSRRRGGPSAPDLGATPIVEPPEPPRGLDGPQRDAWLELWAEPVARFWSASDGVLVARLIRLRDRLDVEGADAPLGMYAAVLALERVLYLTPTARRDRLRLAVSDPPAAVSSPSSDSSANGARRAPSARERERLLRG